jgi:hypothetical protein
MKRIYFITTCVLIILVGPIAIYTYFTFTPTYSLWQIKKAIARHNWIGFEKYVNVDNLIKSFSDDLTEAAEYKMSKSRKIPELFSANIKSILTFKINTDTTLELKEIIMKSKRSNPQGFLIYILGDTDINKFNLKSVSKQKHTATATISLPNGREMLVGMKKENKYWRVENIINSKELYNAATSG